MALTNLASATNQALTIGNLQFGDSGDYRLVATNSDGAVTSAVAHLTVNAPVMVSADALVLVNSTSAKYPDFQHYLKTYLDHFGFPYSVLDLATNAIGTNLGSYALIIIGHSQLDTNQVFLNTAAQLNLAAAVANGTGLVNFDRDLAIGTTPRYQFVQDVFGFNYSTNTTGANVTYPATEPGAQLHFITARHQTNETLIVTNMSLAGLVLPTNATAVAMSSGRPFITVKKYGQGRAVQWSSYDWMAVAVKGPLAGLDDLVWRSLVWAARKPFAMRGLPNFAILRVDDCEGPFWWAHIANEVGFKPWLGPFFATSEMATNVAELRNLATNGNATVSIHAFSNGVLLYFGDYSVTNYTDVEISNRFYTATRWHQTNGIPIAKIAVPHVGQIHPKAFAYLKNWGVEYLTIKCTPGTLRDSPWLINGPFRLYETQRSGASLLPLFYADFLTVPGHPEFAGQFFDCVTEIRDDSLSSVGEWGPDGNDIPGSINRGTRHLERAFDSMVLATLYTHEWRIHPTSEISTAGAGATLISTNNWRTILQTITNNLAAYQPIYVTMDYACQYVRATRTSRLTGARFDVSSGHLLVDFTGKTDLDLSIQIFSGEDNQITSRSGFVPMFTNDTTVTSATLAVPPVIVSQPPHRTVDAGSDVTLPITAGGTEPLGYQWWRNGTNTLSGATNTALSLAHVLGDDTAEYTLVVTNTLGSVTSAPVMLTVMDPVIVLQPVSRTNHAGTTATFTIGVNGTSPAYQWLKDNSPAPGQTNPTLLLPAISDADAATYRVQVSNSYGIRSSSPASLTVAAPLKIEHIALTNGTAAITWSSIPGNNYLLQLAENLDGANWSNQPPPVTAFGTNVSVSNPFGGTTQRFYRVLQLP